MPTMHITEKIVNARLTEDRKAP